VPRNAENTPLTISDFFNRLFMVLSFCFWLLCQPAKVGLVKTIGTTRFVPVSPCVGELQGVCLGLLRIKRFMDD
jgi:hypothetical protein